MARITEDTVLRTISRLNNGQSTREATRGLHVSQSTVSRIQRRRVPENKRRKVGRPRALSMQQRRLIVRKITSGQFDTAVEAQKYLAETQNVVVSTKTIRRNLMEAGLRSTTKIKKPLLKPRHIKERLAFCRKYKSWTKDDWRRVLWSDETKVNRMGSDGRKWCWKKPGAQRQPNHVQQTVKHGGGNIMVWGCMSVHGVGNLVRIDGGLDAQLYCKILEEDLASSVEFYGENLEDFIFQQDNDPNIPQN
jgi:transposase